MNKNRFGPALVTALLLVISACASDEGSAPQAPPLPVQVAEVERRDVPLEIEMVGSTFGIQDVPIRARVEGFVETMNFREGSFVKAGDLLYTIDPQPFKAKVVEAQSKLAAAQTALAKAESDLGRIRPLAEMKAVSEQDLDGAVAEFEASQANVRASQAGVELAEIELGYTRISAPIAGLIGLSKAKPGEFVGRDPNPVVLNVVSDIDPIRVRFSISEREYLILARGSVEMQQSGEPQADAPDLTLLLTDGSEFPYTGKASGAAQSIDPETGTYTIEALFPNPDQIVLPGQFARVRASYTTLENAVVVPRLAVTELQGRFRVFLVNDQNKVEVRDVAPGPTKGNDQVINEGLQGGERVIVEGLQKVRPGMLVAPSVKPAATPRPPLQTS